MNADCKTWGRVVSRPFHSWKVGFKPNPYHRDYLTGIGNTLARRWPWPRRPLWHTMKYFFRDRPRAALWVGGGGDGGGWSAANVHHMYLQPHVGIVSTRENCADMQNCTTACQLLDTARETRRTEACSCAYVYLRNVGLVTSSVYHLLEPSQPTCQARTVLSSVLPTAKNNPSGLPMQGLQEGFLLLCLVWGPSPPTSLEGRSSTFCLYNPQCTVSMQENVCGINE